MNNSSKELTEAVFYNVGENGEQVVIAKQHAVHFSMAGLQRRARKVGAEWFFVQYAGIQSSSYRTRAA